MHRKIYFSSRRWYRGQQIYDLITLLLNTHLHFKGDNFVSLRHGFLHTYNVTTKEQSACAVHKRQLARVMQQATQLAWLHDYIQGASQVYGLWTAIYIVHIFFILTNFREKIIFIIFIIRIIINFTMRL